MALVSVLGTGTRASTELVKLQRKVQGVLLKGYNSECEEWGWLQSAVIPKHKINISAREMTSPIDIRRATKAAIINEGGYEANPTTVALNEVTLTWSNYNIRSLTTLTSKYLSALGQDNQIMDQFKYQAMKRVEGLAETVGRDFYGFSTGYWCQTTTVATASSGTAYTLANLYGQSSLGSTAQLGALFTVGDRVALVRSAALVTNAIGTVTAVSATTPSITVTWNGSVTSASGDNIVLAMAIENTTLADGTNYNKALVGLHDGAVTASVHSLSSGAEPAWAAGYSDTAGGRWSGVKQRKMKQGINNNGGGELNLIIWDQGVSNDVYASQSSVLRFQSALDMPLDGQVTDGKVKFKSTRRTPATTIWGLDTRNSVAKFSLLDFVTEDSQGVDDGDKLENQNAQVFSDDMPLAMVWKNRGNLGYASGVTTQ